MRAATTIVPDPEVVTVLLDAKVPLREVVPASTVPPEAVTVTDMLGDMPDTVTVLDVYTVDKLASVTSVNEKAFGVVSAAWVVTE